MKKSFFLKLIDKIGTNTLFDLDRASKVDKSLSKDALKEEMSRLADKGIVLRISNGIYLIQEGQIDIQEYQYQSIFYRYIRNENDVYGFLGEDSFIRSLQNKKLPKKGITIITNKATSGKKTIKLFDYKVILKKSFMKIDKKNADLLCFLTYISQADIEEIIKNHAILASFLKERKFATSETLITLNSFPNKTAKKIIISGLYKYLLKH